MTGASPLTMANAAQATNVMKNQVAPAPAAEKKEEAKPLVDDFDDDEER